MTLDRYTCLETVRRLDDYLDRELSERERHEVERHLETCDRCLQRFRFEAAVVDDLRTKLRRVTVPGALESRPAPMKTDVPSSRGSDAGSNGTIGLKSTAPRSKPGRRRSRLAAMFAPFENPTATIPSRSS